MSLVNSRAAEKPPCSPSASNSFEKIVPSPSMRQTTRRSSPLDSSQIVKVPTEVLATPLIY